MDAIANLSVNGVKKDGDDPQIYFNATKLTYQKIAAGLYNVSVSLPLDEDKVSFTVAQGDNVSTRQLDNPAFARTSVVKMNYNRGDEEDADDDEVTIELAGRRISDLHASVDGADPQWQGQAFNQATLILRGLSKRQITVTLTDSLTKESLPPIFVHRLPAKVKKPPTDTITILKNSNPQ